MNFTDRGNIECGSSWSVATCSVIASQSRHRSHDQELRTAGQCRVHGLYYMYCTTFHPFHVYILYVMSKPILKDPGQKKSSCHLSRRIYSPFEPDDDDGVHHECLLFGSCSQGRTTVDNPEVTPFIPGNKLGLPSSLSVCIVGR